MNWLKNSIDTLEKLAHRAQANNDQRVIRFLRHNLPWKWDQINLLFRQSYEHFIFIWG